MGLTHIKVNIANPAKPRQALELSFLVDSGAVYSVVPAALLRKLRIRPHSKRTFILADGSEITRKIGDVLFRLNGRQGAAPVIFGENQVNAPRPWAAFLFPASSPAVARNRSCG